jgi:hypothetical protein
VCTHHPLTPAPDGRFRGDESVTTIQCDQTGGTCNIPVPAPGFALVFFNPGTDLPSVATTATFATTTATGIRHASVDPSVVATSNGHSGSDRKQLEGTSKGSGAAPQAGLLPGLLSLVLIVLGAVLGLGDLDLVRG